jgi:DNA-binding MarR family transcriptional regulator
MTPATKTARTRATQATEAAQTKPQQTVARKVAGRAGLTGRSADGGRGADTGRGADGGGAGEDRRGHDHHAHKHDSREAESSARLRAVIGRLSRRLRPTLAGSGLTPSQISVLFTVVRIGPLGLSELAGIENLNPTMLSRITARLCELGLIRRTADPLDRRAALVQATAAGRRMRERIHRERTQALSAHVQTLDEHERQALWDALPVLEQLADRLPGSRTSGSRPAPPPAPVPARGTRSPRGGRP